LGLSALLNCQIFETVIGIRFNPNATKGDMKNVMIVIAVVGKPIPIIPLTIPAMKYAKPINMKISLGLFVRSKINTLF
tara:strand:+ start:148 stop:381 length:234 start_codon:yes stop_codon:yes gene_type:complete